MIQSSPQLSSGPRTVMKMPLRAFLEQETLQNRASSIRADSVAKVGDAGQILIPTTYDLLRAARCQPLLLHAQIERKRGFHPLGECYVPRR
eukprot:6201696-Pleurochrysis_carterae.AAC.1